MSNTDNKEAASVPVWFEDPLVLMKHNQMTQLWPQDSMSRNEKINAISRLVILLTILGYALTRSIMYVVTGIATLSILGVLFFTSKKGEGKNPTKVEGFQSGSLNAFSEKEEVLKPILKKSSSNKVTMPTEDNPFMNVMLPEISTNPTRGPAAPAYERPIEKDINAKTKDAVMENFDDNEKIRKKLFSTLGDNLEFENMAQHNFYATANTEVPNNQKKFLEFCYGSLPSGKELHSNYTSH